MYKYSRDNIVFVVLSFTRILSAPVGLVRSHNRRDTYMQYLCHNIAINDCLTIEQSETAEMTRYRINDFSNFVL